MPITNSNIIFIFVILGLIVSFFCGVKNLYSRFEKPNYVTFMIDEVHANGIEKARYVIIKNGYVSGDGIYSQIFRKFASDVTYPIIDTSNMYSDNKKLLTSVVVRNDKDLRVCMIDSSCIKEGIYDIMGKVFDLNDLKDDELNLLKENYELSKNCIYIKTFWEKPGLLTNLILTLLPLMFVFYFRKAIFHKKRP